MLILKLATRNLFRQLGRNALSMVSIIMGVLVIIAGRGMANGLDENVYRAQIHDAGHVVVVPPEKNVASPTRRGVWGGLAQLAFCGKRLSLGRLGGVTRV